MFARTHTCTHAPASVLIHIMTMVLQKLDGPCTSIIYLNTTWPLASVSSFINLWCWCITKLTKTLTSHSSLVVFRTSKWLHNSCGKYKTDGHVLRNTEARSRNYCCRGKATSTTYCVCVRATVALVIEHVTRMRCIIRIDIRSMSKP
jgi:hypothetical protein